jgi:hypothetical protein
VKRFIPRHHYSDEVGNEHALPGSLRSRTISRSHRIGREGDTMTTKTNKSGSDVQEALNKGGEALVKLLYRIKKPSATAQRAPGWVHAINDWLWNQFWA